ncbi:MAG: hypothetical protein WBK51_15240 [Polaromonas sp.]
MLNTFVHFMTFQGRQTVIARPTAVVEPTQCAKTVHKPQNKHLHVLRYMMDSWFGAVLGGGVYGAWAVWANWSQGANTAWGIGAAHWLTSALLTFFGTLAMRQFYGRGQPQMWVWSGSLRAFAGGLGLTYASLFAAHGLLGTQHLLLTLAPGIVPNILFCASYALLLKRTMTAVTP